METVMFEVGSDYEIVTLVTGENHEGKWATYESSIVCEVGAVDGTLVKLLGPEFSTIDEMLLPAGTDRMAPRDETILNTTSLFFVRATKVQRS